MKINKKIANKIICFLFILTYIFSFSVLHTIIAEEAMPDTEALKSSIRQDAANQTNNIGASATTSIVNTGDDVNVDTSAQNNTRIEVNNQNTANINQNVNAVANTGNNEASRNISFGGNAGVINTGNASVNVTGVVDVNSNKSVIGTNQGGVTDQADIVNTGNNLTTTTNANSTTQVFVNNNNTTTINQTANAVANTGGNVAERNISFGGNAGVITTGNAVTNVDFLVTANGNVTLVGGDSNGNGPGSGASIFLANTGDNSRFTTRATTNNFIIVTNENRATISQACGIPEESLPLFVEASQCLANTGNNDASRNIANGDAGVITTGDARVDVFMAAIANRNFTEIFLDPSASANSDIVNTGDDVNVDTSAQNNTRIEVNNQNTANINQNVNAVANTGNNTANRNISFGGNAGVITTGDAEVNVGLLAEVNKNVTKIEEKVAIPTVTPKVTITPTVTPTATPTPSVAGVAVTPTATPTPTAAAVTVTPTAATPTPTGAVAGVAVTPTVTPAPAVGGVAVTQLPAAGSESILLGLIDAFMILFLGVIFKKASKTVINS